MKVFPLLLLLWPSATLAQINESFDDGDFTRDPVWTGDTASWEIDGDKLHSNRPLQSREKDTFYLSTSSGQMTSVSWEFWLKLGFNTSRSNRIQVYLTSQTEDPLRDSNKGYFIEVGGTADKISLCRKDTLQNTILIEGAKGITNHSSNILKIKVVCDKDHRWTLYTDDSGAGYYRAPQGTVVDSTYSQSSYFSIVVFQSGKGASKKHWFDAISIQPYSPDTLSPTLEKITFQNTTHLQLHFSEPLATTVENKLHYVINLERNPDSVYRSPDDPSMITLRFPTPFQQKESYELSLHGIMDPAGNILDTTTSFTFFLPETYDVIIEEIYADPTPSHGLPEYEYVEILNVSNYPIHLGEWQFCDPVRCAVLPERVLPADSLLILCDKKYQKYFIAYGATMGLAHFPTLNNTGDQLSLKDDKGKIIHTASYDEKSYQDYEKARGGWSIEMSFPEYPCLVSDNWSASQAPSGGTPGAISLASNEAGHPFVGLEYVEVKDSVTLLASFNAGLDTKLLEERNFSASNLNIDSITVLKPLFTDVLLHLQTPLEKRKVYTLNIQDITACGLTAGTRNSISFGSPEIPLPEDLFINEILFNPKKGSADFIEIYNASKKIIDIRSLQLANRNKDDEIASVSPLSTTPIYLFPEQYTVVTIDKKALLQQYYCKYPKNIVEVSKMPSYPNTSGTVLLVDKEKHIIDEVAYDEGQQNEFFHHNKGVSLEKINTTGPSNDPDNWTSASSISGYATPTYRNSQALSGEDSKRSFEIKPQVFSPDGDGYEDQTFLIYKLKPGYAARIQIYNESGGLVRKLRSHISLGAHNRIPWNGKNDNGQILPTGIYIVDILLYHPKGKVGHIKLPVVLAKRR